MFVVAGRITFEPQQDAETVFGGGYLVPGLVDTHAHLSISSPAPDADAAGRVCASAQAHLEAGVLAVREPGSPDHESVHLGPHLGLPRVYTAGRFLAPPGRYFPGLARPTTDDELADAAEQELEVSGGWVKVIGDDPAAGADFPRTYRDESLLAVAKRVHALGGRIAIHTGNPDVIDAAVAAVFDSIEHGVGLSGEHIARMARGRIAFVPTMMILDGIRDIVESFGTPSGKARRLLEAVDRHPDVVRRAYEAGVRVLAGTDAGMVAHGLVRHEIDNLLKAGFPPGAGRGAGSWGAREFLGLPGIEEGAPADIVGFADDPAEPEVLARPAIVILDGRVMMSRIGTASWGS